MSENVFKKKAEARAAKVDGSTKAARPKRVKLTLSMTEDDRAELEAMANTRGVTMATLVHLWIEQNRADS